MPSRRPVKPPGPVPTQSRVDVLPADAGVAPAPARAAAAASRRGAGARPGAGSSRRSTSRAAGARARATEVDGVAVSKPEDRHHGRPRSGARSPPACASRTRCATAPAGRARRRGVLRPLDERRSCPSPKNGSSSPGSSPPSRRAYRGRGGRAGRAAVVEVADDERRGRDGPPTPRLRSAPRTNVVLPAPSSPETSTTSPGASARRERARPARLGLLGRARSQSRGVIGRGQAQARRRGRAGPSPPGRAGRRRARCAGGRPGRRPWPDGVAVALGVAVAVGVGVGVASGDGRRAADRRLAARRGRGLGDLARRGAGSASPARSGPAAGRAARRRRGRRAPEGRRRGPRPGEPLGGPRGTSAAKRSRGPRRRSAARGRRDAPAPVRVARRDDRVGGALRRLRRLPPRGRLHPADGVPGASTSTAASGATPSRRRALASHTLTYTACYLPGAGVAGRATARRRSRSSRPRSAIGVPHGAAGRRARRCAGGCGAVKHTEAAARGPGHGSSTSRSTWSRCCCLAILVGV